MVPTLRSVHRQPPPKDAEKKPGFIVFISLNKIPKSISISVEMHLKSFFFVISPRAY